MMKDRRIIQEAAELAHEAVHKVLADYRRGNIDEEDHITSNIIRAIKEAFDGAITKDISWDAMQLKGRGPRSPESRLGPDFVGVVVFDLANFKYGECRSRPSLRASGASQAARSRDP